jgi:hypothetical protein
VENERLLTEKEVNKAEKGKHQSFIGEAICQAQDAKSYKAGRQDAAREIFEEIYSSFGNYTHITKSHVRKIQKHFRVTE